MNKKYSIIFARIVFMILAFPSFSYSDSFYGRDHLVKNDVVITAQNSKANNVFVSIQDKDENLFVRVCVKDSSKKIASLNFVVQLMQGEEKTIFKSEIPAIRSNKSYTFTSEINRSNAKDLTLAYYFYDRKNKGKNWTYVNIDWITFSKKSIPDAEVVAECYSHR